MKRLVPFLVLAVAAPMARADVIDLAFVRDQAAISKAVRDVGVERVAVLKFEVQVGDRPATFDAGLANSKLPQKLENLLVLANDATDPLLILSGAAEKAAALPPTTTWRTPEGRTALVGLSGLPLAWDQTQKLTPEAFVAGQLKIAADYSTATVTLYAFTKANPAELKTIYTTPASAAAPGAVKGDRSLLGLAGVSYSVDKANLSRIAGDESAMKQVSQASAFATTLSRSPVRLAMTLNGKPVEPVADPDSPGAGRVSRDPAGDPKVGDSVSFKLTNTSDTASYAVVLAVNGKNTNAFDKTSSLADVDPKDQRKWVLGPKKDITLDGFYTDDKGTFQTFRILGDSESEAVYPLLSSQFRGLITMHVFAERTAVPVVAVGTNPPQPKPVAVEEKADAEMALLALGVGGSALDDVRNAGGPDKAKETLQQATNVRPTATGQLGVDPVRVASVAERGLIVEGATQSGGGSVERVKFNLDPNPVAFVQIRYYGK